MSGKHSFLIGFIALLSTIHIFTLSSDSLGNSPLHNAVLYHPSTQVLQYVLK